MWVAAGHHRRIVNAELVGELCLGGFRQQVAVVRVWRAVEEQQAASSGERHGDASREALDESDLRRGKVASALLD
jgi:hypothetical protein